jgi:hypothetical protein
VQLRKFLPLFPCKSKLFENHAFFSVLQLFVFVVLLTTGKGRLMGGKRRG